jgi:hypothetical protein
MKIETNATVTLDVKSVNILNLMLTISRNELLITAPYQWLDTNGKVVRSGCNMYKETDLTILGDQKNAVIAVLKSLIPITGKNGNCNVILGTTITARKGYMGDVKWESEVLTQEQFLTAVSPLTLEQITQMVTVFTTVIFA